MLHQDLLTKISSPDGAELVDTRPFVLPVSRTGVKFPDAFASMVTRITAAIRGGRPVVLDVQDSSPHWWVFGMVPFGWVLGVGARYVWVWWTGWHVRVMHG